MSRRGRKRQLEIESEYWRLLACGVGTVDACRTVGIGRKTGYRWRAENGGVPPVRLPEAARATRYLSLLERHRIAALKARGHGVCDIAEQLGRSPSTISRELRKRGAHPRDADLTELAALSVHEIRRLLTQLIWHPAADLQAILSWSRWRRRHQARARRCHYQARNATP
jgi:transposase, IS30 family